MLGDVIGDRAHAGSQAIVPVHDKPEIGYRRLKRLRHPDEAVVLVSSIACKAGQAAVRRDGRKCHLVAASPHPRRFHPSAIRAMSAR